MCPLTRGNTVTGCLYNLLPLIWFFIYRRAYSYCASLRFTGSVTCRQLLSTRRGASGGKRRFPARLCGCALKRIIAPIINPVRFWSILAKDSSAPHNLPNRLVEARNSNRIVLCCQLAVAIVFYGRLCPDTMNIPLIVHLSSTRASLR